MKHMNQVARDRDRQTYRLRFPDDLKTPDVVEWINSISGTLASTKIPSRGDPTIVFEMWATDTGIQHYIKVPWQEAGYIMAQLQRAIPGLRYDPGERTSAHQWTSMVELAEVDKTRTFDMPDPESLAARLLASVGEVADGEAVMMQWVVAGTRRAKPPTHDRPPMSSRFGWRGLVSKPQADKDEINDRREKLSKPNFHGVLRVAARAGTDARADHLLYNVRRALRSISGPHNGFKKRSVPTAELRSRLLKASTLPISPFWVSSTELAALIAWPIGAPHIGGLSTGHSRHLPANENVSRSGIILATGNFPGSERPLAVTPIHATKHFHVIGQTGTGKTTLLETMAAQNIAEGHGVIVMESKGDLFNRLLMHIPSHRVNDVVVMDLTDMAYPVGFNILTQGPPEIVASDLQGIFTAIYGSHGVRVPESLYHGLMTLMTSTAATKPMTFVDLVPLFAPMSKEEKTFSDMLIRGVPDPHIRNFWQRIDNLSPTQRDNFFGPIMERIWQLNNRAVIRNVIGQSTSSFDIAELLRQDKILLVNLVGLGDEVASLVGTLLFNSIWHAVKSGATRPDKPTFLYLDEFQNFMHLPVSFADMTAQARSFGLSMVLAHQYLGQLPIDLRTGMTNARNKVIFQVGSDDASYFAREFGRLTKPEDFMHLGFREVVARLVGDQGMSAPVTGVTNEPPRPTGTADWVRNISRTTYGRRLADVEAEIYGRQHTLKNTRKHSPRVGMMDWDEDV